MFRIGASRLLFLPAAVGLVLFGGWSTIAAERQQDFSRDPNWEGVGNRLTSQSPPRKRQDFGYQDSNRAGGQRGEIGGTVWQSIRPAYYAKDIGPLTMEDRLTASGKFALTHATAIAGWQTGSSIVIGFFHHADEGWRPRNFLGFSLTGYNQPDGALIGFGYGSSQWESNGGGVNRGGELEQRNVAELDHSKLLRIAPDGAPHTWSLEYDPTAGSGTITLTIDGRPTTVGVGREHRKHGAIFDRFGIANSHLPGNSMTAYFDDLIINGEACDFATDPGWDAKGNQKEFDDLMDYGMNDFGYSLTARAGGERGEIGGRLWQVQEPAYFAHYGDDVGRLSLDLELKAKGKLAIPRFATDAMIYLGWYNAANRGVPLENFVGVGLNTFSSRGCFMAPTYATSQVELETTGDDKKRLVGTGGGGPEVIFLPDGRVYDWSIRYDPQANGGAGAMIVRLGDQMTALHLAPGDRAAGAELNRFGIFNAQGNNGKDAVIYLDDLIYTVGE